MSTGTAHRGKVTSDLPPKIAPEVSQMAQKHHRVNEIQGKSLHPITEHVRQKHGNQLLHRHVD